MPVIHSRVSQEVDDFLSLVSLESQRSKSSILDMALSYFIENSPDIDDKKRKLFKQEMRRSSSLKRNYGKNKSNLRCMYHLKNTYRRVLDLASFQYYIKGTVNMDMVKMIVKDAIDIYQSFPKEMKEVLKDDLEDIRKLQYKKYLMDLVDHIHKKKVSQSGQLKL